MTAPSVIATTEKPAMKFNRSSLIGSIARSSALVLALTTLSVYVARAHPYASGISNNAGTIQFILNESADNVGVSFDLGAATNNLGPLARGLQSFALGVHT